LIRLFLRRFEFSKALNWLTFSLYSIDITHGSPALYVFVSHGSNSFLLGDDFRGNEQVLLRFEFLLLFFCDAFSFEGIASKAAFSKRALLHRI